MEESLGFSQKLCGQHHRLTQVPLEHILYEVPDLQMRILTANYIYGHRLEGIMEKQIF